ncbi:MAG: hypothetical protein H0V07_11210 [Propionibacteriales bacterium]|nr:hypothetical protein [Propionibacteriales bacterium]
MAVSRRVVIVLCVLTMAATVVLPASGSSQPRAEVGAVAPRAAARPYVVTLGDSYISGEAGRWAGSSNVSPSYADALGPTAYDDNRSHNAERIPKCHRSRSAEAYLGHGVGGLNLACSGARTTTYVNRRGRFKPGLDFYRDDAGNVGQASALRHFAASHRVVMVVVSIGGNDFNFASVVRSCVTDFLTSPSWSKDFCSDDPSVAANFTSGHIAAVKTRISRALVRVRRAMRRAGYADPSWTLVVQTYPSVIPNGHGFRYSQAGFTRQSVGGCGFWNADAHWANASALRAINRTVRAAVTASGIAGAEVLGLASALKGRRLCESGVGLYEEVGLTSWTQPRAVNRTEWVNQIRTLSTVLSPYEIQESLHPNYWGQLAFRRCLRRVYHHGVPRGGSCVIAGKGLRHGEPRMRLR